jgi:hypothetical protein
MKANRALVALIALALLAAFAVPSFAGGGSEAKNLKIAYIRATNEPYYKYGFDGA